MFMRLGSAGLLESGGRNRQGSLHIRIPGDGTRVRPKKAAQVQGHEPVQGTISLRTVAVDTPKSFATRAGLNPALTAARTMLAFAGGMSTTGAGIRTIRAAAGLFCFVTGGTVRLQPPTSEAGPIPRRRASPMATRADQVNQVVV